MRPGGGKARGGGLLCLLEDGREAVDVGGLEINLASCRFFGPTPGLSCPSCRDPGWESDGRKKGFSGASGEEGE